MHYRFLFDNPAIVEHFHKAILDDRRQARLGWKFRVYYGLVRPFLPLSWRQKLQGSYRVAADEQWYLPKDFVAELGRLISAEGAQPIIHPWPKAAQFGFILSHDVESVEGMSNILAIAQLEESLGFRSAWYIVPHKYKVDAGILRELHDRGFEVGVHGYNHDGRLFLSKRIFDRRSSAIRDAARRFQASGFRAPMMHRNIEWIQDLGFEYDCTFADFDPYQAMPGGVRMVWPFLAGNLVILPTTMPQDHTLFVVFKESNDRIWREKLEFLKRCCGLAQMLTHPDYLLDQPRIDIYRSFLEHVREHGDYWHGLPREAAEWWRQRDASRIEKDECISGPAAEQGCVCHVSANGYYLEFSDAVSS